MIGIIEIIENQNFVNYSHKRCELNSESFLMLNWMIKHKIWKDQDQIQIQSKTPIFKTGTMVYHIEDPNKIPYRWKIWDDNERILTDWDFIDESESDYIFELNRPWNI